MIRKPPAKYWTNQSDTQLWQQNGEMWTVFECWDAGDDVDGELAYEEWWLGCNPPSQEDLVKLTKKQSEQWTLARRPDEILIGVGDRLRELEKQIAKIRKRHQIPAKDEWLHVAGQGFVVMSDGYGGFVVHWDTVDLANPNLDHIQEEFLLEHQWREFVAFCEKPQGGLTHKQIHAAAERIRKQKSKQEKI